MTRIFTRALGRPSDGRSRRRWWLVGLALVALGITGCGDDPVTGRALRTGPPTGPSETTSEEAVDAGQARRQYTDRDFTEAETNRDPFRNFASTFVTDETETRRGQGTPTIMPETSVEDMRLIGVVTGMATPRAMLVDRSGVGHTVRRGDFVGRPERAQTGDTQQITVELRWRVERIRENEVVLMRESEPNSPPLTRVIPLRDEETDRGGGALRASGAR